MFQKYSIFIILSLFVANCNKDTVQSSKIPQLTLASVEQLKLLGKDSVVNVTLNYTDGDGDIGLDPGDTLYPFNYPNKYFYNMWVSVYRIDDGVVTKVITPAILPSLPDTINFNERILNLTPTGKSKSIRGDIKLFIRSNPYPGVTPDSMFYTFQLFDRDLNASNIVKSDVMLFKF